MALDMSAVANPMLGTRVWSQSGGCALAGTMANRDAAKTGVKILNVSIYSSVRAHALRLKLLLGDETGAVNLVPDEQP